MFKKFKPRVVETEAVQWDGTIEMGRELAKIKGVEFYENTKVLRINDLYAEPGDWIIAYGDGCVIMFDGQFQGVYEKSEEPKKTKSTK